MGDYRTRSRTNTSLVLVVSPGTRFLAAEANTTYRSPALTAGATHVVVEWAPVLPTLTPPGPAGQHIAEEHVEGAVRLGRAPGCSPPR